MSIDAPLLLSLIENARRNIKKTRSEINVCTENGAVLDYLNHVDSILEQAENELTRGRLFF